MPEKKVYVVREFVVTSDSSFWRPVGAFLSQERAETLWLKLVEGKSPHSASVSEIDLDEG